MTFSDHIQLSAYSSCCICERSLAGGNVPAVNFYILSFCEPIRILQISTCIYITF